MGNMRWLGVELALKMWSKHDAHHALRRAMRRTGIHGECGKKRTWTGNHGESVGKWFNEQRNLVAVDVPLVGQAARWSELGSSLLVRPVTKYYRR